MLTLGSLFSGIGGLELGLEWAGVGPVRWQVEQDAFCRQVLAKHWPDAVRHDDVRTAGAGTLEPVDVICGGFPCQDLSLAGKRAGLAGARSGLWFEYARIVRELRPRFVVVENVAALVDGGLDTVLGDLAALGYGAWWDCVRAADAGAPHRRERLFLVAFAAGVGRGGRAEPADLPDGAREAGLGEGAAHGRRANVADAARLGSRGEGREEPGGRAGSAGRGPGVGLADAHGEGQLQPGGPLADLGRRVGDGGCAVANPDRAGLEGRRLPGCGCSDERTARANRGAGAGGRTGAAESRVGRVPDGLPAGLDGRWPAPPGAAQFDWEPPRTAREVPNRPARLKALGNAVVPQVAYAIGRVVRALAESEVA
jgi:DNA (cytosine-5)-methyltransferase 1